MYLLHEHYSPLAAPAASGRRDRDLLVPVAAAQAVKVKIPLWQ